MSYFIVNIYHHYHIISRSHLARVGESVGSLATFTARRGREQLWSSELRCSGSSDGPEEAVEIRKALAEVTGAVWGSVGTCGNHSTAMDWEVCSTDLKLWQRWLTLWIFVKPLKLSRVELVKCNHHCLRFDGRGELNWQLESVHDFRRNGWYLQATCTVSSVNDTNYWNIRADQSLQNMLKLGTLLHNSRCRKYVGWCRLRRKN